MDSVSSFVARMLTAGGDRRIVVPAGSDANQYGATPFPRTVSAYASSTANDISADAFAHLLRVVEALPKGPMTGTNYGRALEAMRQRLRAALALPAATDIVFAPSGTDLEYVALAVAQARSGLPVSNILLGADEVGSGCVLSAAGRYFAHETAVAAPVAKGATVAGLEETAVQDIEVRCAGGMPHDSRAIALRIGAGIQQARQAGRHPLVHIVHGSKTGLVLPCMEDIDTLIARFGDGMTLVVDACQARLDPPAIRSYLDRGAIVFLTGSKFVGGPPFSGFALVPRALRATSPLPASLATIFRGGEWPSGWPGVDRLNADANPGLLLRLEAAMFELERFAVLPLARRKRVIRAFSASVRAVAHNLGARLVDDLSPDLSLERATLATIDLSGLPGAPDFATAQRYQRILAARGLRLGQPVKCVPLAGGGWGGTLRISLSMPLIVALDGLDDALLNARLQTDMGRIADILLAATRPVAA